MNKKISISPSGEKIPLPKPEEYKAEFEKLKKRISQERAKNREIVVVMGVGFVGAVMAAIVADTVDKEGKPSKFDWNAAPECTKLLENSFAKSRYFSS